MKYFKVRMFNENISIDETELARALYAQITGKVAILKNGSVSGNQIFSITPDYHKAMGYNEDYKLTPEDHKEIAGKCRDYIGVVGEVKNGLAEAMRIGRAEDFIRLDEKTRSLPVLEAKLDKLK
jgi:hypothetical protein